MPFESFAARVERDHAPSRSALVVVRSLPSTNDLGRHIVGEYLRDNRSVPATDIVAWKQTGGRGRHDRAWSSPGGAGVWVSMVRGLENPARVQRLPLAVGVGLVRALRPWVGGECGLKWPNDVVVEGRKLAGILVEGVTLGSRAAAVLGFGVNVTRDLDSIDAPNATSVLFEIEAEATAPDLVDVASACFREVGRALESADPSMLEAFRAALVHRPGDALRCRIGDTLVEGAFVDVDERGLLVLDTEDGQQTIAAAEVLDES